MTDPGPSRETGRFGAFEGVFVPTTLTILGVILFVRSSWVVGQVGLLGAWAVMAAAYAISATTALSLASIVSNVRVEAGGAFAVLSRTLGIEPGGSIGLPLYLSQTLAITIYLFGFREGWLWLFPEHPAWAVDVVVYLAVFVLAGVSARLAFRVQYLILALIVASLVSVFTALPLADSLEAPTWWTPGGEEGLQGTFAVFFPAVTGIMAGVNMSGDLKRPQRAIIRGSLWAVGITFVVYLSVAAAVSVLVPADTLAGERTALIDVGAWSPIVLVGLLAATFSSALSTAVGAPRILAALADHQVLPASRFLAVRRKPGEPTRALVLTGIIVGVALLARDLNVIAPYITLTFLLTYGAINATLLLQQGLDLPRFRPSFRVPLVVPLVGTVGCGVAMWIVSPVALLVCLAAVAGVYVWLLRRPPEGPYGQVRAGLLIALSSRVIGWLPDVPTHFAWQAHLVVPWLHPERSTGLGGLTRELARGGGSVLVLTAEEPGDEPAASLVETLDEAGIATRRAALQGRELVPALSLSLEILGATLLPPNILLVPLVDDAPPLDDDAALPDLLERTGASGLGLWLVDAGGLDAEEDGPGGRLCIWLDGYEPVGERGGALELLLVGAWRFQRAWGLEACVTVCLTEDADDEEEQERAQAHAEVALQRARLPRGTARVRTATVADAIADEEGPALHMVVLHGTLSRERVAAVREVAEGRLVVACLSGEARAD